MGSKQTKKKGDKRLDDILSQLEQLHLEIEEAAGAREARRIRHLQRRRDILQEELDELRYELQQQGRAYLEDAEAQLAGARECRSRSGSREAMICARESIEKSAKAITLFTGGRPPTDRHYYLQAEIDVTLQALPDIPARRHNFLRVFVHMNMLSWVNTLGTYAPEYRYASKYMRDLFTNEEVDLAIEWAWDSFAAASELITWIDEAAMKL